MIAEAGTMVRTFQGYVERKASAIIGAGTSAISSTPRMHWQNHAKLVDWETAIADQRLPVERGFVLDDDDRVRAAVIDRLMCDGRVELGRIVPDSSYFAQELRELAGMSELASYDPASHAITTTSIGRLLVRNVCMLFDRYRTLEGAPRFSSTI
jgi:oxygen-independent coproporphyrinogen III oxidase